MMKKRVFDDNYNDIIELPHHTSPVRDRMSMINRAAQFSPFAALTGYDEAVKETARVTKEKIELDENAKTMLDEKLQIITEHLSDYLEVTILYFQPDMKKTGGEYVKITGAVKKIDQFERNVRMMDGTKISIDDLMKAGHDGTLEEVFGTGTAAVISPVGSLRYKEEVVEINNFEIGELTQKLYDTLYGIQSGKVEDTLNWTVKVCD